MTRYVAPSAGFLWNQYDKDLIKVVDLLDRASKHVLIDSQARRS